MNGQQPGIVEKLDVPKSISVGGGSVVKSYKEAVTNGRNIMNRALNSFIFNFYQEALAVN